MTRIKQQLVTLWKRPDKDGTGYTYYLRYKDLNNQLKRESLEHCDERKAERQRLKKEKELRMGFCPPTSMRLSEFVEDCLRRSGNQIRPSTKNQYTHSIKGLIEIIGDIDYQSVKHQHGEQFRQALLDKGNAPTTVAKKLRETHSVFQLAVKRKQLEENPFHDVKPPRFAKNKKIRMYTPEECERLIKAASELQSKLMMEWNLTIVLALTTGLRKSEILNMCWSDISFDEQTITVTPKQNTEYTWEWNIKDHDMRTVPLTDDVMQLLINLQSRQPAGCPYVVVPPARYEWIQNVRKGQKSKRHKDVWRYDDSRVNIIPRFSVEFDRIKKRAGITNMTFHDIRRTAITNWFYAGLEINEVMRLAGHSKIETTVDYYLAVKDDLMNKARKAVKFKVNREMMDRHLIKDKLSDADNL